MFYIFFFKTSIPTMLFVEITECYIHQLKVYHNVKYSTRTNRVLLLVIIFRNLISCLRHISWLTDDNTGNEWRAQTSPGTNLYKICLLLYSLCCCQRVFLICLLYEVAESIKNMWIVPFKFTHRCDHVDNIAHRHVIFHQIAAKYF